MPEPVPIVTNDNKDDTKELVASNDAIPQEQLTEVDTDNVIEHELLQHQSTSETLGTASIATINNRTIESTPGSTVDHDKEQYNTSTALVRKVISIPSTVPPHGDMRLPNLVSTDDISNDSIQNLDINKSSVVTSHSDILTKECFVLLKPITDSNIQDTKENVNTDKKDTVSKDHDSGYSENDSTLHNLVNTDPVDCDDPPLSVLHVQNRGRPCRHKKGWSTLDRLRIVHLIQTSSNPTKNGANLMSWLQDHPGFTFKHNVVYPKNSGQFLKTLLQMLVATVSPRLTLIL